MMIIGKKIISINIEDVRQMSAYKEGDQNYIVIDVKIKDDSNVLKLMCDALMSHM